jgi:hypothetical protein
MAIESDEQALSVDTNISDASRSMSELDLTEAGEGPVWRQYLRAMGPGLVTGASDDDPSGIATYSQAGARFGPVFLWTALLTLPLMTGVQEICDRTALATVWVPKTRPGMLSRCFARPDRIRRDAARLPQVPLSPDERGHR